MDHCLYFVLAWILFDQFQDIPYSPPIFNVTINNNAITAVAIDPTSNGNGYSVEDGNVGIKCWPPPSQTIPVNNDPNADDLAWGRSIFLNDVPIRDRNDRFNYSKKQIDFKPDKTIKLGMVARLEQHKDHVTLIKSIAEMNKNGIKVILSIIYFLRGFSIIAFIYLPPSNLSSIIFGASFGLLWLSTVPATSGIVAHIFGTKFLGLLYGLVFLSHQIGSFFGAYLGGLFYDIYGSYDYAWYLAIALSVFAGLIHLSLIHISEPTRPY